MLPFPEFVKSLLKVIIVGRNEIMFLRRHCLIISLKSIQTLILAFWHWWALRDKCVGVCFFFSTCHDFPKLKMKTILQANKWCSHPNILFNLSISFFEVAHWPEVDMPGEEMWVLWLCVCIHTHSSLVQAADRVWMESNQEREKVIRRLAVWDGRYVSSLTKHTLV